MHGGRSRQLAIVEFAPNCEIIYRKKKYQSIGIDLTNPDRNFFYICNNCLKFYSTQSLTGKECPLCKKIMHTPDSISSISPKKIFIQKTQKSLSESSDYREAQFNIFLPEVNPEEKPRFEVGNYSFDLKNYGNIRLLLIVNDVYTDYADPDEIDQRKETTLQICSKCGRAKKPNKKKRKAEKPHYPLNQKFNRKKQRCTGSWTNLALHHEMPTNVISIKINEKIKENQTKNPSLTFLTTLKNAIIFAGQSICESGEGEISGIVKDGEIILYDNVDGGAGYVDVIFDRFEEVLRRANRIVEDEYETYHENCDHGCLRCLWSYRNKRDIKLIDKQLILPLLQECSNLVVPDQDSKKKLNIKSKDEFKKNLSLPGNKENVIEIKNNLRSAKKKIVIFTPLISTNQIDFNDEGLKEWADILGSIRTGEKSVSITVYLKQLNLTNHSILRKLIEAGVDVLVLKHDYFEAKKDELGDTLLIVDPYNETRKVLEISGALTEKLWNEVSTIHYTSADQPIKESLKKIEEIEANSQTINLNDLTNLEKIENYRIKRRDRDSLKDAVNVFNKILDSANYEIKIFDGHMRNPRGNENLRFYISYLCRHLNKNVVIQIVTCGHDHASIIRDQSFFNSSGYNIQIVSFDEQGYDNPIHRRFVVIDKQKSIRLDKGLRFLFDYQNFGTANNETIIEIHSAKNTVDEDVKTFDDYWNYNNTSISGIKERPKIDTRGES